MAYLTFRYEASVPIRFGLTSLTFLRSVYTSKPLLIPYEDGTGQQLTNGEVLYTTGVAGTDGYVEVVSNAAQTLSGAGNLSVDVKAQPTATQQAYALSFYYNAGEIKINMYFNSPPIANDVTIIKGNREVHEFSTSDFSYTDMDGDVISEVVILGDTTGYSYNGSPYVSGTWINASNVNLLAFTPPSQDTFYEKTNQFKVKDTFGNISN